MTLCVFMHTKAQRYPFQWLNLSDSINKQLTKAYGTEDVGAGYNVYNLLIKDDFRLQNGIYAFKGMGPHFSRQLFIYNNGIYIFSDKGFYQNIILDFVKCIKQLNLSNEQIFLYLTVLYNYLQEEYEDDFNNQINGNDSLLDVLGNIKPTSIVSPIKLFRNEIIKDSINISIYGESNELNPPKIIENLADYIERNKLSNEQILIYIYRILCHLRPTYSFALSKYYCSKDRSVKYLTEPMMYGKWYNQTKFITNKKIKTRIASNDYAFLEFLKGQNGLILINNKLVTKFKWKINNNKLFIYNRKHNGIFNSIKEKEFIIKDVFIHYDTMYIELKPLYHKKNIEVVYVFSFVKST